MLLECRVNDRALLVIDAESVGGVDKSMLQTASHPDKVIDHVVATIQHVASRVGEGLSADSPFSPSAMEVSFAVRVDANSTVQIAKSSDQGQFRVTLRWHL